MYYNVIKYMKIYMSRTVHSNAIYSLPRLDTDVILRHACLKLRAHVLIPTEGVSGSERARLLAQCRWWGFVQGQNKQAAITTSQRLHRER